MPLSIVDQRHVDSGRLTAREASRLPQWAKTKIMHQARETDEVRDYADTLCIALAEIIGYTAKPLHVDREELGTRLLSIRSVAKKVLADTPPLPSSQVPDLTDQQTAILMHAIQLEGPYADDKISDHVYTIAYVNARKAGLEGVLETLATHYVAYHASADEITASAATAETMRATIALAYVDR